MMYQYICRNPKCPRHDEKQEREYSPQQWETRGEDLPIRCLSCGWALDFLGASASGLIHPASWLESCARLTRIPLDKTTSESVP